MMFAASVLLATTSLGCKKKSPGSPGSCTPTYGASVVCSSCVESSCNTEVTQAEGQCVDYFNCISACGCGTRCEASCQPRVSTPSCQSAYGAVAVCQQTLCTQACAGSIDTDAATPAAGGTVCNSSAAFECTITTNVDQQNTQCARQGGTIVTTCPTPSLVGCCTVVTAIDTTETCYYIGNANPLDASSCEASGGTWSASP